MQTPTSTPWKGLDLPNFRRRRSMGDNGYWDWRCWFWVKGEEVDRVWGRQITQNRIFQATSAALGRQELLMYGVLTNKVSIAGCAVVAASRRCQQECCRSKTDLVIAVWIRFFGGGRVSWSSIFFWHDRVEMLMAKNSDRIFTSLQGIIDVFYI